MVRASWTHAHTQKHHASLLWSVRVLVHMLCKEYLGAYYACARIKYVYLRPILSEPPALCVLDARAHA
jgi:hypothetical protein